MADEKLPSGRLLHKSAVKVTCTVPVRTVDNDLILPGTPGTLLRWAQTEDVWGNGPDVVPGGYADDGSEVPRVTPSTIVVVAFDAYMFVDSTQCASRHCLNDNGIEATVSYDHLRYLGSIDYVEVPTSLKMGGK